KAVADSLKDRDGNIRAAALDLVAKRKDVQERPEVRSALEALRSDPAPRLARLASALIQGSDAQEAFAELDNADLLDFDFFVQKIQPIFAKRGADSIRRRQQPLSLCVADAKFLRHLERISLRSPGSARILRAVR